ncbi:hypothetical protein V5F53_00860 [Xanthobacter sp. V4C-4]|uniref:hypothetical protein n=1 Tax=Xanthobacter cornucopiae TaxID=3119924 RepID=UPI0037295E79
MIAELLIPSWPISLPLCWFLAYRFYRAGAPEGGSITDLHAAAELHRSGALTDEELERIKLKALRGT